MTKQAFLYDKVTEDEVVRFIEQWMTVLGLLARYSSANTAVLQGTERLYQLLPELTGSGESLEFAELHNVLQVNNALLSVEAQQRDTIGAFLFLLMQHNIRRLSIAKGVSAVEFQVLMEYLRQSPEEMRAPLAAVLRQENVSHIVIEQYVNLEPAAASADDFSPPTSVAEAPKKPEPPIASPKPDPRHVREEVRPPETLRVTIVVRVGTLTLDKAEVSCAEPVAQTKLVKGEAGATLFLPAGENEIVVKYESYQIRHKVEITKEGQIVEIDLQKIF